MTIVNLTQYWATPEQVDAGVVNLKGEAHNLLINKLIFKELPTREEIWKRARGITDLAWKSMAPQAMIGGAPFLMMALETEISNAGIEPLYAYPKRVSKVKTLPGGKNITVKVFKHGGFISAWR